MEFLRTVSVAACTSVLLVGSMGNAAKNSISKAEVVVSPAEGGLRLTLLGTFSRPKKKILSVVCSDLVNEVYNLNDPGMASRWDDSGGKSADRDMAKPILGFTKVSTLLPPLSTGTAGIDCMFSLKDENESAATPPAKYEMRLATDALPGFEEAKQTRESLSFQTADKDLGTLMDSISCGSGPNPACAHADILSGVVESPSSQYTSQSLVTGLTAQDFRVFGFDPFIDTRGLNRSNMREFKVDAKGFSTPKGAGSFIMLLDWSGSMISNIGFQSSSETIRKIDLAKTYAKMLVNRVLGSQGANASVVAFQGRSFIVSGNANPEVGDPKSFTTSASTVQGWVDGYLNKGQRKERLQIGGDSSPIIDAMIRGAVEFAISQRREADDQDLTAKFAALENARAERESKGGSKEYTAQEHAQLANLVEESRKRAEGRQLAGRKILVVFSDGLDTSSTQQQDKLLRFYLSQGVQVYAVVFPNAAEKKGPSTNLLVELSKATGGRYVVVEENMSKGTAEGLISSFVNEVANIFSAQYSFPIQESLNSCYGVYAEAYDTRALAKEYDTMVWNYQLDTCVYSRISTRNDRGEVVHLAIESDGIDEGAFLEAMRTFRAKKEVLERYKTGPQFESPRYQNMDDYNRNPRSPNLDTWGRSTKDARKRPSDSSSNSSNGSGSSGSQVGQSNGPCRNDPGVYPCEPIPPDEIPPRREDFRCVPRKASKPPTRDNFFAEARRRESLLRPMVGRQMIGENCTTEAAARISKALPELRMRLAPPPSSNYNNYQNSGSGNRGFHYVDPIRHQ
jgi:hypothetical protein